MTKPTSEEWLAIARGLLSAITVASFVLICQLGGWLKPLQFVLEDLRFSASPRAASDSLVIVQIDPASISYVGRWPWPRGVHAQVIDKLIALRAKDIAIDIDFSSPSTPSEDTKLAEALRRAGGNVILPAFKQATFASNGMNSTVAKLPIGLFAEQSWIANVNVLSDADGKVREMTPSDTVDGQTIPALAVMLGGFSFNEKRFRIDYGIDPSTIDRVSVAELLQNKVAADRISNKKVIVGATAIELRDYVLVPVHGFISGPLFHAVATETLLQNRILHDPGLYLSLAFLAAAAVLGGALLARRKLLSAISVLLTAAAAVEATALFLYSRDALLIDTSGIQCLFVGFGLIALLQEIDLSKINLGLVMTEARNLRAVLAQVVTDNFDGIIIVDEAGLIEASSERAGEILNVPRRNLEVGRHIENCLPIEFRHALEEAIDQFRQGAWRGLPPAECLLTSANGVRVLEYVVTPSRLQRRVAAWRRHVVDRHVACLTFRDITEQRQLEQETFRLARYSELTGLPNRHSLYEKVNELLRKGNDPLAIMVLDVDRFRTINTTLGHKYGDTLLQAVANRLTSLSGEVRMAAHLGADDFALILGGWTRSEELSEIANLIIFAMSQPYSIGMRQLHLSLSAGVFVFTERTESPLEAAMMADNALLAAKQSGGGTCKFHQEEITAKVAHRQAIEIDLWLALEKKQFEVLYQPQVDLFANRIIGAEALLRWNHPSRGQIPPSEFIPIAEVTGMIIPLGRWALQKACCDAAAWRPDCKVAVNLSVQQLLSGNLISDVEDALQISGLSREQLELEVTEGVFIHDTHQAIDAMQRLRHHGIKVSLDDFGTGYSSLSYLSSFPFNRLKIDKSFVSMLHESATARAIVTTIVTMAQRIKIGVIAEGIETAEQVRILRLLGCREGQGFYYGEPQAAERFALALLQEMGERLNSASKAGVIIDNGHAPVRWARGID